MRRNDCMKNTEILRSYFDRIVNAWVSKDIAELRFIRSKTFDDYFNGIITYNQSTVILGTISNCMLVIEREKI